MNKTARKHSTFSMARKVVIGFLLLAFVGTFLMMPAAFAEDSVIGPFTVSSNIVGEDNTVTITCGSAAPDDKLALVDPNGTITINPGNTVTFVAAANQTCYACMVGPEVVDTNEIQNVDGVYMVGERSFTEILIPAAASSSSDDNTSSDTSSSSSSTSEEGGGEENGEDPTPVALAVTPVSVTTQNGSNRAATGEKVFVNLLVNQAGVTFANNTAKCDGLNNLEQVSYAGEPDANGMYSVTFSYTVSGKPTQRTNTAGELWFGFALTGGDQENPVTVSNTDFSKIYYKTSVSEDVTENPNNIRDITFEKIADKDGNLSIIDAQYAKAGDTVQVSFVCDANEGGGWPGNISSSNIGGINCSWSSDGADSARKFTFTAVLGSGLTHKGPIPFTINLALGGGKNLTITQTDAAEMVVFLDNNTQNTSVKISGTYEDTAGAAQPLPYELIAAGDTLILDYTFDRPVTLTAAPVAVAYSAKKNGAQTDLAVYDAILGSNASAVNLSFVVPDLTATDPVDLWAHFSLYDLAGNPISNGSQTLQYVTPGEDGEPSEVKLSTVAGASVARVGNQLSFSFDDTTIAPHRVMSLAMGNSGEILQELDMDFNATKGVSTYSAKFELPKGFNWVDNTVLDFTVSANDLSDSYFSFTNKTINDFAPTAKNNHVLTFYAPIKVESVSMSSDEVLQNMRYARIGSTLTILLETGHPVDLTDVYVAGVLLTGDKAMVRHDEAPYNGKVWTIEYTLPDPAAADAPGGLDLKDNTAISFSFKMSDGANEDVTYTYGGEPNSTVTYYAPLTFNNVDVVNSSTPAPKDVKLAKNGDLLTITFTTGHPLMAGSDIDYELIWGGKSLGQITSQKASATPAKSVDEESIAAYTYTITYQLPDNGVVNGMSEGMLDQSFLDVRITARDIFTDDVETGVPYYSADPEDPGFVPVQYFAPITFSNIVVSSSNATPTMYAKAGDTITVEFTTNHMLDKDAPGTIGTVQNQVDKLGINPVRQNSDGTWLYRFTSGALADGDVADLGFVEYAFKLEDPAGNTTSQGRATSQIRYYEAITATVGISSNNARSTWAKNGDTITVSASTHHETSITASTIAGRAGTSLGDLTTTPSAQYLIPGGEASIPEGQLNFSITLQDPAGNTLTVNKADDGKNMQVTYDRTLPVVTLLPVYSGFSGKDISFLVVYADEHMDPNAISFLMNDAEQITGTDRAVASSGTSFSKSIELTKDNEYRLKGTISDMAGNRCALDATASVILDKTKPVIKVLLDRNTFISGTTPNQIFSIEELYIKDIICSITDQDGVNDWDMDDELITEGKKTVFLTAEDMAGNTATPLSYDIYIDGTAPQPTAQDTESGTVLTAGGTTTLTGSKATVQVSLASIHMGDEKPDSFTKLQLLDDKGNVLKDTALSGTNNEGPFSFELPSHGNYTLVLEATDDVGNETGRITYDISFEAGGLIQLLTDGANPGGGPSLRATNPALFYSLVIGLPVLALGIFFLILLLAKRRKEEEDEEQKATQKTN